MDKKKLPQKRSDLLKQALAEKDNTLQEKVNTLRLSREIDKDRFEKAIRTILKK
jgi:hypothetical protein